MNASFARLAMAGLLAGCAHSQAPSVTMAPAPAVAAQPHAKGTLAPAASASPEGAVTICVIDPSSCDKQQCGAKASCGAKAACAARP